MTFQNQGIDQTDYALSRLLQKCTFPIDDETMKVGDKLRVRYPYSSGEPLEPDNPTRINSSSATSIPGLIPTLALPAGTLPGDLLLVTASARDSVTNPDRRLTNVVTIDGSRKFMWGYQDNILDALAVGLTGSGSNGQGSAVSAITYRNAKVVGHGGPHTVSVEGTGTPVGKRIMGRSAVMLGIMQTGTVAGGFTGTNVGWTIRVNNRRDYKSVFIHDWLSGGGVQESPAGTIQSSGTWGTAWTITIETEELVLP